LLCNIKANLLGKKLSQLLADYFDGTGGVGGYGFRSTADQEAAEAAAAVGAEYDPIGGPGGGFFENDLFGRLREDGDGFRGGESGGFESFQS
jgi:hypothetical protein